MTEYSEKWVYTWTGTPRKPKGPPADGTFTLKMGIGNTPYNALDVKGTLIRMKAKAYDHAVYHAWVWGRRVRVVQTREGSVLRIGGRDIDYFPRRRAKRMAGK